MRQKAVPSSSTLALKPRPTLRLAGTGPGQLSGASYAWAEPLFFIKTS